MKRSNEALPWSIFAAGGTVAAIMVPVLLALTGLAGVLGWDLGNGPFSYDRMRALLGHWLAKIMLLGTLFAVSMHCAHRARPTFASLGLRFCKGSFGVLFYVLALAVTGYGAYLLLRI
jgi:fumarate reductase subunit D